MTLPSLLIIVLVIGAVLVALGAGGRRHGLFSMVLAIALLVPALGAFALTWTRAGRGPRQVTLAYSRTTPKTPAALVRLDNGKLTICADYLQDLLPAAIGVCPPPVPCPEDQPPEERERLLPATPQPPPAPEPKETEPHEIAVAVEQYFEQLVRDRQPNKPDLAHLRSVLAQLKTIERRRLASDIAQRSREWARRQAHGAAARSAELADSYILQLDGGPDRWRRLAALGDTRSALHDRPGLAIRLLLLVGTIAVAALVLRASTRRAARAHVESASV